MTIGTIGTPACIARWKPPFLKRPHPRGQRPGALGGDHDRRALRAASVSAWSSAARACVASARSMKAKSAMSSSWPMTGIS